MAETENRRFERHHDATAARLERRREMLDDGWSWDDRAFVDRKGYDTWRKDTDKALEAAERVLADRRDHSVRLAGVAYHPVKGLRAALSGAREVLRDDDRHMAETLVPERKGDDRRRREERIAGLLDNPEKLRELYRRQIERREARKAARRQRKGRHQIRSMRM